MGYSFSCAVTAWATVLSLASVVLSDNVVSLYYNLKFIDVIFFLKNNRQTDRQTDRDQMDGWMDMDRSVDQLIDKPTVNQTDRDTEMR